VTRYVLLVVHDHDQVRNLIRDLHAYPQGDLLTPVQENPVRAKLVAVTDRLPDTLTEPVWATRMQATLNRLDRRLMSQQGDIDAITTDLGTIQTSLGGVHDELATGIKNLEDELAAKGVTVDLTALSAARDSLASVRDSLQAQADAVPQPTPPPAP
jgi:hypothetical protein